MPDLQFTTSATDEPFSCPAPAYGIPETLGPYRLIRMIGIGGMATVFLARSRRGGRRRFAALKVLSRGADEEATRMFRDEAQLTALLRHPSVCRTLDHGEHGGFLYIAMEHLYGEPLSRCLNALHARPALLRESSHAPLVATVVRNLAEGLHHVHEVRDADGVPLSAVHRDVTPDNLIALHDGTVRVLDFGIARYARRTCTTESRVIKGKLAYMSPEQMAGEPLDRRTDVWSLGVVLWELLTGTRLFSRRREFDVMRAVLEANIPPPSTRNPAVAGELDRIVLRALDRDRGRRWSTARSMADALSEATGSAASPAAVAGWMRRLFPHVYDGSGPRRTLPRLPPLAVRGPQCCTTSRYPARTSDPTIPSAILAEPASPAPLPSEPPRMAIARSVAPPIRHPSLGLRVSVATAAAAMTAYFATTLIGSAPAPHTAGFDALRSGSSVKSRNYSLAPRRSTALAERNTGLAHEDAEPRTPDNAAGAGPLAQSSVSPPTKASARNGIREAKVATHAGAATSPEVGHVVITAQEHYRVTWHDLEIGTTPLSHPLPPGRHRLVLHTSNGAERSIDLSIAANQTTRTHL